MAGTTTRGRHRRAEDFAVRRWIAAGAASAGVGAALLGLSAVAPAVALADDAGSSSGSSSSESSSSGSSSSGSSSSGSSSSASSSNQSSSGESSGSTATNSGTDAATPAGESASSGGSTAGGSASTNPDAPRTTVSAQTNTGTATEKAADEKAADDEASEKATEKPKDSAATTIANEQSASAQPVGRTVTAASSSPAPSPDSSPADTSPAAIPAAFVAPAATPVAPAAAPSATSTSPWVTQTVSAVNGPQQFVTDSVTGLTQFVHALVSALPLPPELKWHVEGAFWAVRRSFLNLAPSVAAVQLTGQSGDPVSGRVDATDPEGDAIVYRLVTGPKFGTVALADDGSYVYTPGAGFAGVDSFAIAAQDTGLHLNLFDPFRRATDAAVLMNQGAITFAFHYAVGDEAWTPEARERLLVVAHDLANHFVVTTPVTLDYDVTSSASPTSLASAGSDLISDAAGFFRTIVQNKLLSGIDSNAGAADGQINWNWANYTWALGDTVPAGAYDFTSTVMHELLHSFGFLSYIGQAGENTGRTWTIYDGFVVDQNGTRVIRGDYSFDTAFDANVTGGNGGLFLGGLGAVAGYGGALVPIYTPNPWESGSSMHHIDDATFTGDQQKLMNAQTDTGLGVRVLSPVELGILRDLGYTVVNQPVSIAAAAFGFLFVRRMRRRP
ncbi:Ig-like domain-containing protein [Mycolicibacterium grossiae]|uniref:Ig-like domain-containing protein n=1 Tax=Mycolicibacterium grossiae TaxID=1552759 RepID=UPI000AB78CFF|nr:Ig-like domain-containing protein [Mycolicibacterium grossiae]QEM44123.1 hypothetical protein FZ046_04390 [Mycolicibacterium grossiae]